MIFECLVNEWIVVYMYVRHRAKGLEQSFLVIYEFGIQWISGSSKVIFLYTICIYARISQYLKKNYV